MSGSGWVEERRSALALIEDAFRLYIGYPFLFLVLAAGVIVPYEAVLLAISGQRSGGQSSGVNLLLIVLDFALVTPLISALHVHAVADVRGRRRPRVVPVARQGLRVLPVVAAASIIATLGMFVGLLLFVVPGVILWLRWFVVAQTAAIEDEGWLPALRRSADLVSGNYRHVFAFFVCVAIITGLPSTFVVIGFGKATTVGSLLVGISVRILVASFTALAGALLYFDLRLRFRTAPTAPHPAQPRGGAVSGGGPARIQDSWDPRTHSDEERPRGWYVDPSSPHRMHYWGGAGAVGWVGKTRTPPKIRRAWEVEVGLLTES